MDVICDIGLCIEASVCVELQDRLCFKAKKYIGLVKFLHEIFLKTYHFPFISYTRVTSMLRKLSMWFFTIVPQKAQIKTFIVVSYNLGHLLHNSMRQTENMGRWGGGGGRAPRWRERERQTDRQIGCLCHYMEKVM
jgi:hypothetical protein